jgi:hypothetical protein
MNVLIQKFTHALFVELEVDILLIALSHGGAQLLKATQVSEKLYISFPCAAIVHSNRTFIALLRLRPWLNVRPVLPAPFALDPAFGTAC